MVMGLAVILFSDYAYGFVERLFDDMAIRIPSHFGRDGCGGL